MNGPRRTTCRHLCAGVAVGLVVVALACAREEPPSGSRPERSPPSIREMRPNVNEIVPGLGGSAEIRFSEPISGVRNLEQNLVASPAGRYQVSSGFSNLKIRPRDGWLEGAVYYLQVPAGIADLLGNRTEEPILWVFSTGPEISPTRVSGVISRRIDEQTVDDGRVLFFNIAGDSIPYTAVSDREGRFELPHLPPDDYWAFAFEDFNRNLGLERPFEPYDSARFELASAGSAQLSFRIVDPDSTPPVLVRATAQDSLSVRLEFDDYLDPDQDFGTVAVRVRRDDGGVLPVAAVRLEEMADAGRRPSRDEPGERRPRREGGGPPVEEAGGAETEEEATDDAEEATDEAEPAGVEGAQEEDLPPLPSQWLRIDLASRLEDGVYEVSIDSVLNLRKLAGSADTTFVYPEPEDGADQPADGAAPGGDVEEPPADEPRTGEPADEEPPEEEPPP